MSESSQGHQLTRQDLEVVIRRAAELEAEVGSAALELSEADVVRIAQEVGLSEESIRRALAEHQAAVTRGGELLAERGWISRLCGSGLVTATRNIERPAEEIRQEIESHFQANESLRLVRRTKIASLWEPETGVVASLMRGLDVFGKGYQLAKKGHAVEFRTVPLSEESSQVSLTCDLASERAGWFWGLGAAVGVPLAWLATAVILASYDIPNALVLLSPVPLAITVLLARAGYRRAVEKMRRVLDGLLDRVEHGEALEPPRPSWRDLLK
jgi:hypothetical protein